MIMQDKPAVVREEPCPRIVLHLWRKKTFIFDNLLEVSPGVKDNGLVPL